MGFGMKSKRKDIDQVSDDFLLSSPATKIRRLDADLPPIVEDDKEEPNQERAIVLFNPQPQMFPNNSLSLSLDSELIHGFKNQLLRGVSQVKSGDFDVTESDKQRCLAIVPWASSQVPSINGNGSVGVDGEQESR